MNEGANSLAKSVGGLVSTVAMLVVLILGIFWGFNWVTAEVTSNMAATVESYEKTIRNDRDNTRHENVAVTQKEQAIAEAEIQATVEAHIANTEASTARYEALQDAGARLGVAEYEYMTARDTSSWYALSGAVSWGQNMFMFLVLLGVLAVTGLMITTQT